MTPRWSGVGTNPCSLRPASVPCDAPTPGVRRNPEDPFADTPSADDPGGQMVHDEGPEAQTWQCGAVETASTYAVCRTRCPSGCAHRVVATAWLTSSAPRYPRKCRPFPTFVNRFRKSSMSCAAMQVDHRRSLRRGQRLGGAALHDDATESPISRTWVGAAEQREGAVDDVETVARLGAHGLDRAADRRVDHGRPLLAPLLGGDVKSIGS